MGEANENAYPYIRSAYRIFSQRLVNKVRDMGKLTRQPSKRVSRDVIFVPGRISYRTSSVILSQYRADLPVAMAT